jgi:hypothetical protein
MFEDKKRPEQPKPVDGGKLPERGPAKMSDRGGESKDGDANGRALRETSMPRIDRSAERAKLTEQKTAADRVKGN